MDEWPKVVIAMDPDDRAAIDRLTVALEKFNAAMDAKAMSEYTWIYHPYEGWEAILNRELINNQTGDSFARTGA